jgi:heptosyltransferase III
LQLANLLRLVPAPMPVAWIAEADHASVSQLLPRDRPLVALAPTANWAPKVWPPEQFARAFHALAEHELPGATPVVLGGPGDVERMMAAPLLAALPDAIDLVGRLPLPEVAAVLASSALFIGNDSGLMHLSAATGVPTIGLFGPTDASTYGPTGRRCTAIVAPNMDAIAVADVIAAARRLLAP